MGCPAAAAGGRAGGGRAAPARSLGMLNLICRMPCTPHARSSGPCVHPPPQSRSACRCTAPPCSYARRRLGACGAYRTTRRPPPLFPPRHFCLDNLGIIVPSPSSPVRIRPCPARPAAGDSALPYPQGVRFAAPHPSRPHACPHLPPLLPSRRRAAAAAAARPRSAAVIPAWKPRPESVRRPKAASNRLPLTPVRTLRILKTWMRAPRPPL